MEQFSVKDVTGNSIASAFILAALFVVLLWVVRVTETISGADFSSFGVLPEKLDGLIGILFGPLIHGSSEHLLANTLPILILGTATLYGYPRAARWAIPVIYFGSGIGIWLFARPLTHFGSSGLAHGLMFFVFVIGVLRRDRLSIVLAMITFFLYGSMIWSVFPREQGVSFESHLFGAVAGGVMAFLLRRFDPMPVVKRYEWEGQVEVGDDPVIGEKWQNPDPDRKPDE